MPSYWHSTLTSYVNLLIMPIYQRLVTEYMSAESIMNHGTKSMQKLIVKKSVDHE